MQLGFFVLLSTASQSKAFVPPRLSLHHQQQSNPIPRISTKWTLDLSVVERPPTSTSRIRNRSAWLLASSSSSNDNEEEEASRKRNSKNNDNAQSDGKGRSPKPKENQLGTAARSPNNNNNAANRQRPNKNKDSSKIFSDAQRLESTLLPPPPLQPKQDRASSSSSSSSLHDNSKRRFSSDDFRREPRHIQHLKRTDGTNDRVNGNDRPGSNRRISNGSDGSRKPYKIRHSRSEPPSSTSRTSDNSNTRRYTPRDRASSVRTDRTPPTHSHVGPRSTTAASKQPPPQHSAGPSNNNTINKPNKKKRREFETGGGKSSFSSLLPPPLSGSSSLKGDAAPLSSGLSSWEDFLGTATAANNNKGVNPPADSPRAASNSKSKRQNQQEPNGATQERVLPAIDDLFPSFKTATTSSTTTTADSNAASTNAAPNQPVRRPKTSSSPPLEGVLPVSDLFYHASSSASASTTTDGTTETSSNSNKPAPTTNGLHSNGVLPNGSTFADRNSNADSPRSQMPFGSPFASPQQHSTTPKQQVQQPSREQVEMIKKTSRKKKSGRKMVRRGMEMLVGGVPISADPPQRAVELFYQQSASTSDDAATGSSKHKDEDWASAITLNTEEFGPLLSRSSELSRPEKGLYCEYFVKNTMKWGVCPEDLQELTAQEQVATITAAAATAAANEAVQSAGLVNSIEQSDAAVNGKSNNMTGDDEFADDPFHDAEHLPTHDEEDEEDGMLSVIVRPHRSATDSGDSNSAREWKPPLAAEPSLSPDDDDDMVYEFSLGTIELHDIDVPLSLLTSFDNDNETTNDKDDVMKSVLLSGVRAALEECFVDEERFLDGVELTVSHFIMSEMEGGEFTKIAADFAVQCSVTPTTPDEEIAEKAKTMVLAFSQGTDGDFSLGAANAVREETRWPAEVRERLVKEFLDEDEEDMEEEDDEETSDEQATNDEKAEPTILSSTSEQKLIFPKGEDKLILPNDNLELVDAGEIGMFHNFSMSNSHLAPFKGEIGLRLVDAVTERAKQRQPRVIAIGDVHGCIDELQDLLRQCQYAPGDLVVFLGDLVCKGPDSISVVQMAREIGALGVRGNHDFEVIRWHRAIKAGVDPPALRSEHFHIASCLSKEDVKWMHNLPWYISSKDLSALFVHAGFVSGIRLAKQNPRLMMNMRSILPDGTVTSKFFNNWPWARLWDGPQTVLFGHDADRGLQQYEHAIGLDTGCVYGGRLTAYILPERKLVSVSARREYFKYRRKHYD